mmetsp:Transcript_4817/g.9186  ORF Transcript_4817/g.9186 Transcript_4817/m.9186 type:complete len:226 (+) Transcript_4817:109-786(+)
MNSNSILSLFFLFISCVNANNFTVVYKRCKGDTDVIKVDSATVTCDDSAYCTWGSVAQVSGVFTILEDLTSSTADIVTRGFGYRNDTYEEVDICDYVESSFDGAECPDAGTYSFSTQATFPSDVHESWYSSFLENTFGKYEFKLSFEEDDIFVKCIFRLFTENSKRNRNNVNAGALIFVGVVAAAFGVTKRRRTIVSTSSEALLDGDVVSSNFEMMDRSTNGVVA